LIFFDDALFPDLALAFALSAAAQAARGGQGRSSFEFSSFYAGSSKPERVRLIPDNESTNGYPRWKRRTLLPFFANPPPRCAERLSQDKCVGTTCALRPHRRVAFLPPIFDRKIPARSRSKFSYPHFPVPPFAALRRTACLPLRQKNVTYWLQNSLHAHR